MTPSQFAEKMREIVGEPGRWFDTEAVHSEMDDLLCAVLRTLGYSEGVEIFEATSKWYS